jgi:hypothetical protein
VVQSCGVYCAAFSQRLLWHRGTRHVQKDTAISERLQLQFRAAIFNLLNRANFNTPNLIVFTPPTATNPTGLSGTAGAITGTATTARQLQFDLKLVW